MTLREFLNTCDNCDNLRIYKINDDVEISFDPIDDTELVFDMDAFRMSDIDNKWLEMKVQLWSMTSNFGIWVCIA